MRIKGIEEGKEPTKYLEDVDFIDNFIVYVTKVDKAIYINDESGTLISISNSSELIGVTDGDLVNYTESRQLFAYDDEIECRKKIKELVNELW